MHSVGRPAVGVVVKGSSVLGSSSRRGTYVAKAGSVAKGDSVANATLESCVLDVVKVERLTVACVNGACDVVTSDCVK